MKDIVKILYRAQYGKMYNYDRGQELKGHYEYAAKYNGTRGFISPTHKKAYYFVQKHKTFE